MERTIKTWQESNTCSVCAGQGVTTLATHSTTDAQQSDDGTWSETGSRYGCAEHKVTPMVILADGTKMPFAEYQTCNTPQ